MIARTIHLTISLLFWVALALILTGFLKRNQSSAKLQSDGEVHFTHRWWFACSWLFIMIWWSFTGFSYLRAGLNQPLQFVTGVLIGIGVLGFVSTIPGTIVVRSEALEEVHWFWRNKKIRWTDIEEIDTEKRGSTVTVIGSGHRKIVFTNVYPDRARFLLEIKSRCGNDLPPNFPNPASRSDGSI
jgi:hypothetical protein